MLKSLYWTCLIYYIVIHKLTLIVQFDQFLFAYVLFFFHIFEPFQMADYFRGMLIETIEEFGTKNAEGKVVALELELERVKHAHKLELEDAKSNFTRILTEIQLSLARDREELEEKVRAECEAETIRRIELAKSKQWLVNIQISTFKTELTQDNKTDGIILGAQKLSQEMKTAYS